MASLAPQACCIRGVKHEGTPKGELVSIGDVTTYVTGDKTAGKAILFVTDVWGLEMPNNKLLADSFAEQGYLVVVPDLFGGDPIRDISKFAEWLPHHGVEQVEPKVVAALQWIEAEIKPQAVYASGYCFGAKYVIRLLAGSRIRAGAVAHPSLVTIEEVEKIKQPILICGAETDPIYTPELRAQTEAKLKELKARYFLTEASGVAHGFAVRGDPKDPVQRAAKEKAFNDALWWFSLFE